MIYKFQKQLINEFNILKSFQLEFEHQPDLLIVTITYKNCKEVYEIQYTEFAVFYQNKPTNAKGIFQHFMILVKYR